MKLGIRSDLLAATVAEETATTGGSFNAACGTQHVSIELVQVQASAGVVGHGARQPMMAVDETAAQSVNAQREIESFLSAMRAA